MNILVLKRDRCTNPPPIGDMGATLLGKLAAVELGVEAACREQFIVRAALENLAIAHYQDAIGVANRRGGVPRQSARPAMSSSNAACTCSSVRVSMLDVASSSSRIADR